MTPNTLIEDLEHRKTLAGELARFADGRQGLGLGTGLAGALAILNPMLITISSTVLWRFQSRPMSREQEVALMGSYLLILSALTLLTALTWLLLRDRLQARLYRGHGEAGSTFPIWELRVGTTLLGVLGFAGLWIGAVSLRSLMSTELSPASVWGVPTLKFLASAALFGTVMLLAASWRKVRGWRNWLGWLSLCAPFLFFVSLPLFDNQHPSLFTVILQLTLFAGFLYLPFMALYVGLRDHLRYRRLVKELGALATIEAQP